MDNKIYKYNAVSIPATMTDGEEVFSEVFTSLSQTKAEVYTFVADQAKIGNGDYLHINLYSSYDNVNWFKEIRTWSYGFGAVNQTSYDLAEFTPYFKVGVKYQGTNGLLASGHGVRVDVVLTESSTGYKRGIDQAAPFTVGTAEVRTLTISGAAGQTGDLTLTLDDTEYTIAVTAGDSAVAIGGLIEAESFTGWTAVDGGDGTVEFTADDIGVKDGVFSLTSHTVVGNFTVDLAGTAASSEEQTLTVTAGADADGGTAVITLNGVAFNLTLAGNETTAQVAAAVKTQEGTFTGWTVVDNLDSTVTFTAAATGARGGVYSFATGNTGATGTFARDTLGSAGTLETQTLGVSGIVAGAGDITVTLNGADVTVSLLATDDTAAEICVKITTAFAANPNWDIVNNLDGTVTFTAKTVGTRAGDYEVVSLGVYDLLFDENLPGTAPAGALEASIDGLFHEVTVTFDSSDEFGSGTLTDFDFKVYSSLDGVIWYEIKSVSNVAAGDLPYALTITEGLLKYVKLVPSANTGDVLNGGLYGKGY